MRAILLTAALTACAAPVVPPATMVFAGSSVEAARDRVVARCMDYPGAELSHSGPNRVVCSRPVTGLAGGVAAGLTGAASSRNALVVVLAPAGDQVRAQGRIFFETESAFGRVDRSERTGADAAQFVTRFLTEAGARPPG